MIPMQQIAPALVEMRDRMANGATPAEIAAFIFSHRFHVALSHYVEDKAEDGTFAAAVFDILCEM